MRCFDGQTEEATQAQAGLHLVVGWNTEIELRVPEIIKKWIIPIFGPCLQWQPKLLHEGSRIKLRTNKCQMATSFSVPKLARDINKIGILRMSRLNLQ